MRDNLWDYRIRAYIGCTHKAVLQGWHQVGELLMETTHIGDHNRDMEIDIWRDRIKRGEVSHIEVIRLRPPLTVQRIPPLRLERLV